MLDNQLFPLIINVLNTGFAIISSLVPVAPIVQQALQPVQQGANNPPTLYLYKIGPDERVGWPYRRPVWDSVNNVMNFAEVCDYVSQFQLTSVVSQDPTNVNALTAADYANYAAYVLQSQLAVQTFEAGSCGIMNISQIRVPNFVTDQDVFAFSPSLDFKLAHQQIITLTEPIISETVIQIDSV